MSEISVIIASVDINVIECIKKIKHNNINFTIFKTVEEVLNKLSVNKFNLAIIDQNICKALPNKIFKTSLARSTPIVLLSSEKNDEIINFLNPNEIISHQELNPNILSSIIEKTTSINKYITKYERTNQYNYTITEIAELFLSTDPYSLEKPFYNALKKVVSFTKDEGAIICRYNEDTNRLTKLAVVGDSKAKDIESIELEKFPWLLHKFIIESNLFVPNVAGMPPDTTKAKNLLYNLDIGSFALIPIKDSEYLVGALIVFSKKFKNAWSEESRAFLIQASNLFGLTIARRRRRKTALARIDILEGILTATEERYQNIMESLSAGLAMSDEKGTLTYVNSSYAKITGYRKEEIIGKKVQEVFFANSENDRSDDIKKMAKRLEDRKKGISEKYQIEVFKKNGETTWLDISASPLIDSEGNYIGAIAMITDISAKKKLEKQLAWSQKMEAVGRLAGGIAHDFNNLLTVVTGYSEILLKSLNKDQKQHKYVSAINEASKSAVKLTKQLLTVSKREVIQTSITDVNEIIESNYAILNGLVDECIDLDFELQTGNLNINLNSSQLEQIIINLVINSKDSITEEGKIKIRTYETQSNESFLHGNIDIPAGEYAVISVQDSGCGMTKDTMNHLYEPFFTTKKAGTGLGLSTVYAIVKQHKGFISLKTKIDEGSTFSVFFPLVNKETESIPKQNLELSNTEGNESILLVEDESGVRQLIKEILLEQGYKVSTAINGLEALEKYHDEIDLVITDVIMPKLSGFQLVDKLLKVDKNIKILVMSGCTQELKIPDDLRQQAIPFISKPFDTNDFLREIRTLLEQRNDFRPVQKTVNLYS